MGALLQYSSISRLRNRLVLAMAVVAWMTRRCQSLLVGGSQKRQQRMQISWRSIGDFARIRQLSFGRFVEYSAMPASDALFREDYFLRQVESTVEKVLSAHSSKLQKKDDILRLPSHEREAVGVARHLDSRLQALRRSDDCPRCWMQRAHCICQDCPSVRLLQKGRVPIRRIFVVMHHKEIGLKVDTAKLILASFPNECRLVVAGVGPEHQESMAEMMSALHKNPHKSMVLFPDESAVTYKDLLLEEEQTNDGLISGNKIESWDLFVLDGTWAQARKFHRRYFTADPNIELPYSCRRVQLSAAAVQALNCQGNGDDMSYQEGHQLRRHVIAWRQIGTFEATRLFLWDVAQAHNTSNDCEESHHQVWSKIQYYQKISNRAARKELGPPRLSSA